MTNGSLTDLEIVQYPHPTLRYKSKPIIRVDRELKSIVREMFDLMYAAKGIGLAANQVDLPLQLFIINTEGDPETGEESVFLNPVISSPKGSHEAEEGCLSIVGVNALVSRPEKIHVSAYDLSGNQIDMTVDGLLAKAIQHETDHLQGVLFVDKISDSSMRQIDGELEEFEIDFENKRSTGEIPSDQVILKRLDEIESKYCR
ncbi:MAG: peptide deformylase [Mariniblastus sp.]|jgi:peptide deformylase